MEPTIMTPDPHYYVGETRGLLGGFIFWGALGGRNLIMGGPKRASLVARKPPQTAAVRIHLSYIFKA